MRAEIDEDPRLEAAGADTDAGCTYFLGGGDVLGRVADDDDSAVAQPQSKE